MTKHSDRDIRMKQFEHAHRVVFDPQDYIIIRLDGKAFHSYTRNMHRPYDTGFIRAMDETLMFLCEQIQGVRFGYTQSDEISLLLTSWTDTSVRKLKTHPELWMGGVKAKLDSLSASLATGKFNTIESRGNKKDIAFFDSRSFTLPTEDAVKDYFEWRYSDCVRNSISMTAQTYFSAKKLHGVNLKRQREMLEEIGKPWEDASLRFMYGGCVKKTTPIPGQQDPTTLEQVRSSWDIYYPTSTFNLKNMMSVPSKTWWD